MAPKCAGRSDRAMWTRVRHRLGLRPGQANLLQRVHQAAGRRRAAFRWPALRRPLPGPRPRAIAASSAGERLNRRSRSRLRPASRSAAAVAASSRQNRASRLGVKAPRVSAVCVSRVAPPLQAYHPHHRRDRRGRTPAHHQHCRDAAMQLLRGNAGGTLDGLGRHSRVR